MNQIERIKENEDILDEGESLVKEFNKLVDRINLFQDKLKALDAYYTSITYREDLASYDNNELPKDLKCGILSEDAVYDLLVEFDHINQLLNLTETKVNN